MFNNNNACTVVCVHQALFGWPKTKYNVVGQMVSQLDPFLNLWSIVSTFNARYAKWMHGPFASLEPEEIEGEVGEMYRKMYKLVKFYSGACFEGCLCK
jgi:hypothetical protein